MRANRFVVPAVVNVLFLSSLAFAQPVQVERPDLQVGDHWVFARSEAGASNRKGTVKFEVSSKSPDGYVLRWTGIESGKTGEETYTNDLNYITDGKARDTPSSIRYAFPLTQGKIIPVEYQFENGIFEGRLAGKCVVAAWEDVQVPAGNFEAYRLDCDFDMHWSKPRVSSGTYRESNWFAPRAKLWVKLTRDIRSPRYSSQVSMELLSYQVR